MPSQTNSTNEGGTASIAVDFGGTKTSAARITNGRVEEKLQLETDPWASAEQHLASFIHLIESLDATTASTLGVAVSGRVDRQGRWHTVSNNTLNSFSGYPLQDELQAHFKRPVTVMNDAIAAAWAEFIFLPDDEKTSSLLYVTVSTGVGGGLILNGKPVISENGLAGHFGFMTSRVGDELCGSGRLATIESVASGAAIGRRANSGAEQTLSGRDVYDRHLADDLSATLVVDDSARAVAAAIADVQALLDIQVVAIGGSVGLADGYIERVRQHLDKEPPLFRPRILPARMGVDSALFGVISATVEG